MHALFGASEHCIAVNPSDMNVALVALDAVVHVKGPKGERMIPFGEFHRLPGDNPEKDNTLGRTELILSVELAASAAAFKGHVHYLKVRDRSSYAFALVSVAAALDMDGATIRGARLAMGGVAHKPWRLHKAEAFLTGKPADASTFKQAAAIAMQGAKAYPYNKFKLTLAPNAILQALQTASA
jgi:xanthine dehydrogenase YagS FAD-binding subunit